MGLPVGEGETIFLRVPSRLSSLAEVSGWIRQAAGGLGAGEEVLFVLDLALEEIVTNVINHGYGHDEAKTIELSCRREGEEVVLTVADEAEPFNPLEAPEPDMDQEVEDMRIGGLGIHLTRKLMDAMTYERRNGKNILTLRKNLTK